MRKILKFILKAYQQFINNILKGYFHFINRDYYYTINNSQLIINFIFQRILGLNKAVPFSVSYTSKIEGFSRIKYPINCTDIKTSFAVSGGCYFAIMNDTYLEIGVNTIWAHNVCIQTSNHGLLNRDLVIGKSIKIGKNCWIGNSVTILAGVELGDNITIGANSVVTKSFKSNVVIAGCPAKIIKYLD